MRTWFLLTFMALACLASADDDWVGLPPEPVVAYKVMPTRPDTAWWRKAGVRALQEAGCHGQGVTVAVVDTGIEGRHAAFAGTIIGFRDFTGDLDVPVAAYDDIGHGTAVCSLVAGHDSRHKDLWGTAPAASLWVAKVFIADTPPRAHWRWIVAAIDDAIAEGADVVNLSIGTLSTSTRHPIMQAVQRACDSGCIVVCAAGNDSLTIGGPGVVTDAVTVGACSSTGGTVSWSNYGPQLDILSWGVSVPCAAAEATPTSKRYTTCPEYACLSGTSFAAPIVAGVLADLVSAGVEDPVATLLANCRDLGFTAENQGAGEVDAAAAGRAAGLVMPGANECGQGAAQAAAVLVVVLGAVIIGTQRRPM